MNSSRTFNVVITDHVWPDLSIETNIFSPLGISLTAAQCKTETDIIKVAEQADAVNVIHAPMTKKVIDSLANCKIIVMSSVGYNNVDVDAATSAGILLVNCPNYCIDEVADHTMALILSCARGLFLFDHRIEEGIWDYRSAGILARMNNASLGLIGFGRIAQAVAARAKCFGMKIMATDPNAPANLFETAEVERTDLKTLLRSSDYVSIHTPLTRHTRNMISTAELQMMDNSAFIINTSRGGIVNEQALLDALVNGTIRGAALDVMDKEPPDFNNPLLKLENFIATPHAAFYSGDAIEDVRISAADAIIDVFNNSLPDNVVNTKVLSSKKLRMSVDHG